MIKIVVLACILVCVSGHGRLIAPLTRVGHTGYENDPTGSSNNGGNNNDAWVCRHASGTNSGETWTAGETYNIQWSFSAAHVGDCDIYFSYDTTAARGDMTWFKIANYYDCRLQTGQQMPLQLPTWLPSGPATLRFGWYALHQWPGVEFYSQCSDIQITNPNGKTSLPSDIVKYKLIGANPVFQLSGSETPGYPYRFPPEETWMAGPACACGFTGNSCELTEEGTEGHSSIGGDGKTACSGESTAPGDDTNDNSNDNTNDNNNDNNNEVDTDGIPRCGATWDEANAMCGLLCPSGTDAECNGTDTCYLIVDNAPCVIVDESNVIDDCTSETWAVLSGSGVQGTWCQETCSNDSLKHLCDPDVCVCIAGDGPSGTAAFGVFVSSILFIWFTY